MMNKPSTAPQAKPQTRIKPRREPRALTAKELAEAKKAKADFERHCGSTKLIKDLTDAGLIDGWRDVRVTVTINNDNSIRIDEE